MFVLKISDTFQYRSHFNIIWNVTKDHSPLYCGRQRPTMALHCGGANNIFSSGIDNERTTCRLFISQTPRSCEKCSVSRSVSLIPSLVRLQATNIWKVKYKSWSIRSYECRPSIITSNIISNNNNIIWKSSLTNLRSRLWKFLTQRLLSPPGIMACSNLTEIERSIGIDYFFYLLHAFLHVSIMDVSEGYSLIE